MARTHFAYLALAALTVAAACSSETAPNTMGAGGASASTGAGPGSGGGNTGGNGVGGQGGSGGSAEVPALYVGVAKRDINPTIAETWTDVNQNSHFDSGEP